MAMKERGLQLPLESADLTAHRGLTQAKIVPGAREAARFGDRIENPDLIPIHADVPPETPVATGASSLSLNGTIGAAVAATGVFCPLRSYSAAWRVSSCAAR